jgi:hypothetical protein
MIRGNTTYRDRWEDDHLLREQLGEALRTEVLIKALADIRASFEVAVPDPRLTVEEQRGRAANDYFFCAGGLAAINRLENLVRPTKQEEHPLPPEWEDDQPTE